MGSGGKNECVHPPGENRVALLTGASGFIGGRLRARLLEVGYDVLAIRRPVSREPKIGRSVVMEYEDASGLAAIFEKERPSLVFHVAGATKGIDKADFWSGNVAPTEALLAAAKRAAIDRFVHVSSLTAFGPSNGRPRLETDPPEPIELYGESKLAAERAVIESGLPYAIIRPSGVYGPGDADFLELFKWAQRGLNVFAANRRQEVSVVYIDDLVDAILAAATHPGASGKGYFICDGEPVTFERFQRQIAAALGKKAFEVDVPGAIVDVFALGGELLTRIDKKPRLFNRQKRKLGSANFVCAHHAAKADFGYSPKTGLEAGIGATIAWYRAEGWL